MKSEFQTRRIRNTLRLSITASALGMFFFMTIQGGPLALLLQALGAGGIAIGLTTTFFQLGMLAQIPAAFLAERMVRRKPFWFWTSLVSRLFWLAPGIALLLFPGQVSAAVLLTLIVCALFSFLAQAGSPCWFSWMADLIPEPMREQFWGRRQGVVMGAALLATAVTGWFLDLFPSPSVAGFGWLLIGATLMGLLDAVVHARVDETEPCPVNPEHSAAYRIAIPLRNPDFRNFTLCMSIFFFAMGMIGPFGNVYLRETFAVSYFNLSVLQMGGMAGGVVASFLSVRLIKRVGLRAFGLAMLVTAPLLHMAWFLIRPEVVQLAWVGTVPQPVIVLFIASLLAGGIYASIGVLQLNMLTVLSPGAGRTMAMAMHWSLIGSVAAIGPVVGGVIKDFMAGHPLPWVLPGGTAVSYIHVLLVVHGLIFWLLVLPLLLKVAPGPEDWPVDRALMHIFVINPLRAFRNVYQVGLMNGLAAVKTVTNTVTDAVGASRFRRS